MSILSFLRLSDSTTTDLGTVSLEEGEECLVKLWGVHAGTYVPATIVEPLTGPYLDTTHLRDAAGNEHHIAPQHLHTREYYEEHRTADTQIANAFPDNLWKIGTP